LPPAGTSPIRTSTWATDRHSATTAALLILDFIPKSFGEDTKCQRRATNQKAGKTKNLPYWAGFEIGAGDEVRTRDLDLGKVALYQLSYSRLSQPP
jgi:hypothetical protein